MLCAIGIFIAWILAEPALQSTYITYVLWLAAVAVFAFLFYVGLRAYCGRFRRPLVVNNQPAGEEVLWGGFWKTPGARNTANVEAFLAGNEYNRAIVWPPGSLAASAVLTALVLLAALVCGTAAISTAATAAQVALTKKPAREVFSTASVPGLPPKSDTKAPPSTSK